MSRPVLAADPTYTGQRRSLVLAGGGMRVAYQAGVLAALDDAGLRFHHIDGTSGGTMNLSMLLTGQTVDEMCERWRALDPRGFASPLPVANYMRSAHWPGLGSGRGVREKVFPALGIDADEVRKADGVAGTYNVANFATKTAEVFPHTEVDEDLLVAAISLPVLMPAVERNGVAYTDAVWIRDSNVPEAVRQGSKEVWLVWCIGNTPVYRRGLFRQYVHMIEMAATGSLLTDLGHLAGEPSASGLRLNVIKPSTPIPLDPDYFLGHIDGASLIGLGYRDAVAYLAKPKPFSLRSASEPSVSGPSVSGPSVSGLTQMAPAPPALSVTLRLEGSFASSSPLPREGPAGVHLRLEGPQVGPDGGMEMDAVGDVSIPGWPARRPVERGTVRFGPEGRVEARLELSLSGTSYQLRAASGDGRLLFALLDTDAGTEVGTGWLTFGRRDIACMVAGLHASDYPSVVAGWKARYEAMLAIWRAGGG
jgi:predicted acylesterase/phospholipase RssA